MEREVFKQELVKFAKWYQKEEMQRKEKKSFTAIVDDYMQSLVLPQSDVSFSFKMGVEFGYKQCEKGNNLEMALIEFNKIKD